MTDQWEAFPCRIDGHAAFIAVDVGIKDELPELGFEHAVKIEIKLKSPEANGLPSSTESEQLAEIEDSIGETCEENGWAYVGRRTWRGQRDVFIYSNEPERLVNLLQDVLAEQFDYEAGFGIREDSAGEAYLSEVYPTQHDWQVIQNEYVLKALREHGDDGTVERVIEHLMGFATDEYRAGFVRKLRGYEVVETRDPDEDSSLYCVRLKHTAAPVAMHRVAIELGNQVREFDGEYEGWETGIAEA